MPLLNVAANAVSSKMPKVLSPTQHAIADYLAVFSSIGAAAFFWQRNRRAAVASIICGSAALTTSLLTDYPGGIKAGISFHTHGKVDAGMAAVTGMMPNMLDFENSQEANFFRVLALAETAVAGLTDYDANYYEDRRPSRDEISVGA